MTTKAQPRPVATATEVTAEAGRLFFVEVNGRTVLKFRTWKWAKTATTRLNTASDWRTALAAIRAGIEDRVRSEVEVPGEDGGPLWFLSKRIYCDYLDYLRDDSSTSGRLGEVVAYTGIDYHEAMTWSLP